MSFYVRVEDWRFRSNVVGASALRFYCILRSFCSDGTEPTGDIESWAAAAGVSRRTAQNLLTELVKAGPQWVTRRRRGQYELTAPPGKEKRTDSVSSWRTSKEKRTESGSFSHGFRALNSRNPCVTNTHKEVQHHNTTRDARSPLLREHLGRVEAVDPGRVSEWGRSFLAACAASLGAGRPLTDGRLVKLAEVEAEAAAYREPKAEPDRMAALAERSRRERADRDAAREAVLRERDLAPGGGVAELRLVYGGVA